MNSTREEVSMGDRKIVCTTVPEQKSLNLLDFDQCEILAWFVVKTKVAVAFDAGTRNDANGLLLDLRVTRPWRCEDVLDFHGCLLTPNVEASGARPMTVAKHRRSLASAGLPD
jgi:hypothetical protein